MGSDTTEAPSIRRWLLLSGWLEIGVGLGHSVLGTLIITQPTLVTPILATMGWPLSILTPMPPAQHDLVLAMSLCAGTAWMLFGAVLVWQGRARAGHPDVPLLAILFVHQLSFLLLMVLFVRFNLPALVVVVIMTAALATALAKASR